MKKIEVNKLECRFPIFFKAFWWATFVWLVATVVNYFGLWYPLWRLDQLGYGILICFGICLYASFGRSICQLMKDIALMILIYLSFYENESILACILVVAVAASFLYDIWQIADFSDNHTQMPFSSE